VAATKGLIAWRDIRRMLDVCAPGWTYADKTHRRLIYFGRLSAALPRGEHGHRRDPEIEIGHIRAMTRQLGIIDCAKRELEQLR
jgi:hypothetical protein